MERKGRCDLRRPFDAHAITEWTPTRDQNQNKFVLCSALYFAQLLSFALDSYILQICTHLSIFLLRAMEISREAFVRAEEMYVANTVHTKHDVEEEK